MSPYPYQTEAIDAWHANGKRGVVSLPTGAGKTFIAILLIADTQRPTLVHVPTLDLMQQWYTVLKEHFGQEVGLYGGGYHELRDLTVTTYQSAVMHAPYYGNRFGFAIFDECHHLPSDQYQYAAISSIAPFRLGLTATPERTDGKESRLYALSVNRVMKRRCKNSLGKRSPSTELSRLRLRWRIRNGFGTKKPGAPI